MSLAAGRTELFERALRVIPGATLNAVAPTPGLEFVVEQGEGPWLQTSDGARLLDFVLGGGPLVLGHSHPLLLEAIQRAASQGTQHYAIHRRAIELAERIVELVPSAEMVRFTGSGSEATFHGLRLARAVTGRSGIVKFDGGYHGHHDLAVWSFEHGEQKSPNELSPESAGIQSGVADDVVVLPFNDPEAIRALLRDEPDRFAAVICEPFQRALPPKPGFLEAMREACDRAGVVLVFDEIVTGFRFARGGAQERYGVTPDLTTLGKALAGGVPLAALAGNRKLMEHLSPDTTLESRSFHCGTFNGYLLGVECAHVTLDVLEAEDGYNRLEELSQLAAEGLERAFHDSGTPAVVTRAGGLFQPYFTSGTIESASDIRRSDRVLLAEYHRRLLEAGVFKLPAKGYVSLAHDQSHIDALESATRWAMDRISET
jgi:glutamate-1-semialdehyde 2,1-aminomutase